MIAEILKDISSLQVFFAVIAIYVISKFISWYRNPLRKIPGPKGSLLFGNTADFSAPNDGHKVLVEWGRKYGEVFKTWTSVGKSSYYSTKCRNSRLFYRNLRLRYSDII